MGRLLRDPEGLIEVLTELGAAPLAELVRDDPELAERTGATLRAHLAEATRAPTTTAEERWAIADRYLGIEHAQLVVVNTPHGVDRQAAERLVADVVRIRNDDELFADILGPRGKRTPITAVVADLADPNDAGRKKALARTRRTIRSRSS